MSFFHYNMSFPTIICLFFTIICISFTIIWLHLPTFLLVLYFMACLNCPLYAPLLTLGFMHTLLGLENLLVYWLEPQVEGYRIQSSQRGRERVGRVYCSSRDWIKSWIVGQHSNNAVQLLEEQGKKRNIEIKQQEETNCQCQEITGNDREKWLENKKNYLERQEGDGKV
jgi:hypothetical protein